MTLGIDNEEYTARQDKARALMAEKNLSALMVTEPTNLFYFTGATYFGEMSYPRPATLIIPRTGDAVLITHDFHLAIDWEGDIRTYPKVGDVPVEMVRQAFEDLGCASGKVGAEFGREQRLGMSYNDFLKVGVALPDVAFVDATEVLRNLRMVKSEREIAIIARACEIQDQIIKKTFDAVEPGMRTRDIRTLFEQNTLDSEGDFSWVIVCIGDYDPRQACGSSHSDLVLKDGDLLWFDFGITLHGYHTDYCRGMVAGGPSAAQQEKWGKVIEVIEAGIEAVRPGIPISDLYRVQLAAAEDQGLDMHTWPARRFGHGCGLHTTEPPYIDGDDHTPLEPGMVLNIEPGCIENDGIYVLENMVVVTENGCKRLSHAPYGL